MHTERRRRDRHPEKKKTRGHPQIYYLPQAEGVAGSPFGGLVTCKVLFARAPVLGLCFFVSVRVNPSIPPSPVRTWTPNADGETGILKRKKKKTRVTTSREMMRWVNPMRILRRQSVQRKKKSINQILSG